MDIVRAGSNPAGCRAFCLAVGLGAVPPAKLVVHSVAGVMVSIVAFQAVDPGSIPGPRSSLFTWQNGRQGWLEVCLLSLVVEHSLCKRKVGGSIPPVGCFIFSPTYQTAVAAHFSLRLPSRN